MKPLSEESLLGYLKRRSEMEGFPDTGGFLTMLGQAYGRPLVENPGALASDLGLDLEVMEALLPRSRSDDAALDWSFHRMHRDPVCPSCIAAGMPRRKEWRHAMVTACAEHACLIVDECPGCSEPLTLSGDSYGGCLCGTGYDEVQTHEASVFEAQLAQLVAGRPWEMAGIELKSHDAPEAIRTIWFLCTNMVTARTGKEGKAGIPKTVTQSRQLISRAEALLTDWPRGFDEHVVQRWNAPGAEGFTAASRLGAWYQRLLKQRGRLAEELISRCHVVVGTACGDTYKTNRRHAASTWFSAAQAADDLNIRADRIVEAVRGGQLEGEQTRTGGSGHLHTIVRRSDIEVIRALRAKAGTKLQVRNLLGVSKKQFDLLEEANFFQGACRMQDHPCVDGDYDLDEIEGAVQRIASRIGGRGGIDGAIPLREINLRRTTDRKALLQIYRLIADGNILPVGRTEGDRFGDLLFDQGQIERLLKEHGGARYWTAGEVALFTGWKPQCITGWCEQGVLSATKGQRGSLEVWQINEQSLAEFQRRYRVVSDLAKEGHTTSRKILASIAERGLSTVGFQPAGSSSRGHLLRSEDLAKLVVIASV